MNANPRFALYIIDIHDYVYENRNHVCPETGLCMVEKMGWIAARIGSPSLSDHRSAIDSAWPRSRQMAGACWQFGSANYEILRPFLLNCVGP